MTTPDITALNNLLRKIAERAEQRKSPHVTDHAVLRYLERVQGYNIDALRQHISKTCEAVAALGGTCVRAEGVRFEISNGRVVTVTPDRQTPGKTGRALTQDRIKR
jgi:hypothetical protein